MDQQGAEPQSRTTGEPQDRPRPAPVILGRHHGPGDWLEEGPNPSTARPSAVRGLRWEVTLALLAVVIFIVGIATLFIVELWLADRVIPGTYVWDVDLGGSTRERAVERLSADFQYPSERRIWLFYGDQIWDVDPASLGIRVDAKATVEAALAIGHTGDLLTRLRQQLNVLLGGQQILPILSSDPGASALFLSQIGRQVNRPLRNASLQIEAGQGVAVIPGQTGREVDEEATRQALLERMEKLTGGEVALVVRESVPPLVDLEATRSQVERILSAPIVLTAPGSDPWVVEPATLAEWLVLRPATSADGPATLSVSLDSAKATQYVQAIADQLSRPPVNAEFRFDDASNTLVSLVQSVPGQKLDVEATLALVENAAASDERAVTLPVLEIRPSIATEDASNLGIVDLLGEGKTSFTGSSAARVQNISVGTAQFDGLLIAPGETFSFNHYLGEVTAEKGYEEGIIIWGNTTRADVGGGLCQVSSTAFRAAFWAGLPITERTPHAFRVSYYEPPKGLDATIYSPSVDLKWENDTGHHILIHTDVNRAESTVTFRLYGTNPGRTVEMDGPYEANPQPHGPPIYRDDPTMPKGETKQIEWAKDGLDVTVYRIVKQDGVEAWRDTFISRYRPWQAVYLVGTRED